MFEYVKACNVYQDKRDTSDIGNTTWNHGEVKNEGEKRKRKEKWESRSIAPFSLIFQTPTTGAKFLVSDYAWFMEEGGVLRFVQSSA
jgi:hypothetical protein